MDFNSLSGDQAHEINEALTKVVYTKVLQPGDHALDLGANRGDHTREMARLVGPAGLVHAFEPNVAHFPSILAAAPNVRLWPFAAGDEQRTVSLHIPEGLDGWASLQDIRAELPHKQFRVLSTIQVRIDDLLEIDRDRVTFAKIDVERHELSALLGMKSLILSARPVIVLEQMFHEIVDVLNSWGYATKTFFGDDVTGGWSVISNSVAFPKERKIDQVLPTSHDAHELVRYYVSSGRC